MEKERNRLIRKASIISLVGNSVLAVSKILTGIIAGSKAVLGDGLDSFTDVFISIITLVISIIIMRSPDKEHPYGHFRAETIATGILAFIIFSVGGQLALTASEKIINKEYTVIPDRFAIYVIVFSIVGKMILAWTQYTLGKKAESQIILANSKNMLIDTFTSLGVLTGLFFIFYFNQPIIDNIVAFLIGIWIMITAATIFKGTITEVMEGETDMSLYNKVFEEVKKADGLFNPHRLRIRRLGTYYLIEMDVEAEGGLSVKDAHNKVVLLERSIRESIPYVYDIFVHIEPLNNIEEHEKWGLKENDLP
jgi:cation diffusion facilitator family transporter